MSHTPTLVHLSFVLKFNNESTLYKISGVYQPVLSGAEESAVDVGWFVSSEGSAGVPSVVRDGVPSWSCSGAGTGWAGWAQGGGGGGGGG